jgi:hypothetical protein
MAGPHEGHDLLGQWEPGTQALETLEALLDGAGFGDDADKWAFLLAGAGIDEEALSMTLVTSSMSNPKSSMTGKL